MGSTTSSTSAAIASLLPNTEPPGPKPFRPGPQSPAWPLGHRPLCDRPSCALSGPEPNQVDGAFYVVHSHFRISMSIKISANGCRQEWLSPKNGAACSAVAPYSLGVLEMPCEILFARSTALVSLSPRSEAHS